MKTKPTYGRDGLIIDLPDNLKVQVVEPKHLQGSAEQTEAVRDVLLHPIA